MQKDIFQIILDSDKCDEENKIGQWLVQPGKRL